MSGFLTVAITLLGIHVSSAQAQSCGEIAAVAEMARAESIRTLTEARKHAGESYRPRLVLAYRSFQLRPRSKDAAERLLALIPTKDAQQSVLLTLGDSLCDEESVLDMKVLSRVNEGFARELARAVLLAPSFLPSYVNYSTIAVQDPHSEYAVEMRSVCQKTHADFIRAVKEMPEDKRQMFTKHVMNPNSCKVIAVPESE